MDQRRYGYEPSCLRVEQFFFFIAQAFDIHIFLKESSFSPPHFCYSSFCLFFFWSQIRQTESFEKTRAYMRLDSLEVMQFEVIFFYFLFFCYNRYGVNLCDLKHNLCSLPRDPLVSGSDKPHCTRTNFSLGTFLLTLGITWVV